MIGSFTHFKCLTADSGSNAWANLTANLGVRTQFPSVVLCGRHEANCGFVLFAQIGGLIAHCVFFWSPYVWESLKQARTRTQPDPHWQVCP